MKIKFVSMYSLKKARTLFGILGAFFSAETHLLACYDQESENVILQLSKRPFKASSHTFCKKQKRDYDDQIHKLTRDSDYITGKECARVGWVKDLDSYYASKNPSKVVQVPANNIHLQLKRLGDFIKGCSAYEDISGFNSNPANHMRNILLPHISYVIHDGTQRKFIEGDLLRVPMRERESRPIFFISGMSDWNINEIYDECREFYNDSCNDPYPAMQAMGGDYVGKRTRKKFSNDPSNKKHTERWFHEIINFFPESLINPLGKQITKPKKLYAIIIDMYSIWDACPDCQKRFRQEFFKGDILKKIEAVIKENGIQLPRNGLKVIYRMSSQQAYGSQPITDERISQAGGGYNPETGFDIKAIDTAKVTVATRIPPQRILGWMCAYNKIQSLDRQLELGLKNH